MKITKKIKVIILITIIAVLGIIIVTTSKAVTKNVIRPNIILITLDALRADHLGCYGYSKDTSPFIDSIAKESLVFLDCVAQSGSTTCSVPSIFTSKFPYTDGVIGKRNYITLTEFLKKKGYITAAVPGHEYVKKKYGCFSRGFDYYEEDYKNWRNADEFLKLIRELFEKKIFNKNNIFLWLHIREPHMPYRQSYKYIESFFEPFKGKIEEKMYIIRGGEEKLTNKQINRLRAAYDGNIRYADENLKKIFAYLYSKKILKNAVIIITSDHGESLGEHNIFDHNNLYYGILHVLLILKIPGQRHELINSPVSSVDIFPTILDLLGYKEDISKLKLRGQSLLTKRDIDRVQFSEYEDRYSVIKNKWRLYINNSKGTKELFNINTDPAEEKNLIYYKGGIYKSLLDVLHNIIKSKDRLGIKENIALSEEEKESLRALGYLQ